MTKLRNLSFVIVAAFGLCYARAQRAVLRVADFEGTNYGAWTVAGAAFGNGPAQGTLPHQMLVDGFYGHGLVNSFNGGDEATGMLTSPPFKIERKYIQFLMGGGGWEGKTCMNLLLDGKVVRTATGPNTGSDGSEHLALQQWDVSDLANRTVTLQIVDQATGTWGHINVDQIVQTDREVASSGFVLTSRRTFPIEKRYLNLPVKNGAPVRHVGILVDGRIERAIDIELADAKPDWWAFLDTTPFLGQTITIKVDKLPEKSTALSSIDQSDAIKDGQDLYRERLRPQFHFTSRRGWLNDPNGLVFYRGEYHLFYQHNPYGRNPGNMSWGHAVSKDLVHWQELPVALYPDEHGAIWSGSAVVDWNNTAGFQTGEDPALVAMFTAAGNPFTQEIAFSNDRGRTWTKYQNNPVLGHILAENRDPKVVWYAPEKKWVMALYLDGSTYAFFNSPDLKHWQKLSEFNLPGDAECPNLFKIPMDDDTHNERWVFYGASGYYVIGKFDGWKFIPETQPRRLENGNCWYASQIYSDIPPDDGRCILIPWGRLPSGEIFRGMPFNQMMGLPVELTLHSTSSGPELAVNPVRELKKLRQRTYDINPQLLTPSANPLAGVRGDLFEIEAVIAVGEARTISFDLRGVPVVYDVSSSSISCMGCHALLAPQNGEIALHIYVDRASVDIYGGQGSVYMPMAQALSPDNQNLKLSCGGGDARIVSLKVYELRSAW